MFTDSRRSKVWQINRPRSRSGRSIVFDWRLPLVVGLALLAGMLAYQAPATAVVPIGWLGDRLFLQASEGQTSSDTLSFYGDELTESARSGRSRWTHQGALVRLPGVGRGALQLTIWAAGWPDDVLSSIKQPVLDVRADGAVIGQFTPTPGWQAYTFTVPATARTDDALTISLHASDAFTSTARYQDLRPKGVRVEQIAIRGIPSNTIALPAAGPLLTLVVNGVVWLVAFMALLRRPTPAFVVTTLLLTSLALALTFARVWTALLLPWTAALAGIVLLGTYRTNVVYTGAQLVRAYQHGKALQYGLVSGILGWVVLGVAHLASRNADQTLTLFSETFPDSLLGGLLGMALVMLTLVLGRRGLPRLSGMLVSALATPIGALVVLAGVTIFWGGYLASVIGQLPYVGHADYADNAVVARNLVQGRGWVVDYVTQFYQLYPTVTRPQETWPLLQPVWIAPFFAIFGFQNWAAKLPNLLFLAALCALVYHAGARLWDRRIGVSAVVVLVTSHLFFKLVIYATSDLAFVVFCFAAMYLAYLWAHADRSTRRARRRLWLSGLMAGLMMVQKPGSGGLIAAGIGLWLLREVLAGSTPTTFTGTAWPRFLDRVRPVVLWGLLAGMLLMPLIARNLATFGKVYYSTESHDAWLLEYTDWDRIYAVYTPQGGLGSGVPDRSWILRWGFDRTLAKIERQVRATRDYLVPAWSGVPVALAAAWGRPDKDVRLLFDTGAWLALLGCLALVWQRPRLIGLMVAAFVPYTLFLILYWHANEERYFVVVMPWLALLACYALWRVYDRVAALSDGRWAPLGLMLVVAALALMIGPSWPKIDEKVRYEPQLYSADLDTYSWLRRNTRPGDVMMTRNPWQLNWHSQRPALMIPYTTERTQLLRLAQHYGARYLVLDSLQRPEPEVRAMLASMLVDPTLGFQEVYRSPVYVAQYNNVRIELQDVVYRFPEDYGGVEPIR